MSLSSPMITPEKWLHGRRMPADLAGCQTAMAATYVCEISDHLDQEQWGESFSNFHDPVSLMQELVLGAVEMVEE